MKKSNYYKAGVTAGEKHYMSMTEVRIPYEVHSSKAGLQALMEYLQGYADGIEKAIENELYGQVEEQDSDIMYDVVVHASKAGPEDVDVDYVEEEQ